MFISTAVEMPTSSDVTKRREGHTGRLQRNQSQLYSSVEARRTSGTVSTRLSSLHLSCIQSLARIYAQPQLRQIFCEYLAGGTAPQIWSPTALGGLTGSRRTEKGLTKGAQPSWQKPRQNCANGDRVRLPASRTFPMSASV